MPSDLTDVDAQLSALGEPPANLEELAEGYAATQGTLEDVDALLATLGDPGPLGGDGAEGWHLPTSRDTPAPSRAAPAPTEAPPPEAAPVSEAAAPTPERASVPEPDDEDDNDSIDILLDGLEMQPQPEASQDAPLDDETAPGGLPVGALGLADAGDPQEPDPEAMAEEAGVSLPPLFGGDAGPTSAPPAGAEESAPPEDSLPPVLGAADEAESETDAVGSGGAFGAPEPSAQEGLRDPDAEFDALFEEATRPSTMPPQVEELADDMCADDLLEGGEDDAIGPDFERDLARLQGRDVPPAPSVPDVSGLGLDEGEPTDVTDRAELAELEAAFAEEGEPAEALTLDSVEVEIVDEVEDLAAEDGAVTPPPPPSSVPPLPGSSAPPSSAPPRKPAKRPSFLERLLKGSKD